jgi:glycosyltransferase involved in cell wall biosynthesis
MTISVAMATYQGGRFVKEQLASILDQLGPDDEVVVSDDASTDDTFAIVAAIDDPRVIVLRNERNHGYSANFERALGRVTGDLVFVADQDDVWLPGKVAAMVAALGQHDLVVSDVKVVDGDLREVAPSHFRLHGVRTGFLHNFLRTRYIGSAMAMRREVLDVALPLPPRADLCAYDYWLALVAESYFNVGLVNQPLMLYRRHDATASTGGSESQFSIRHRLLVRTYCLWQLGLRAKTAVGLRRR